MDDIGDKIKSFLLSSNGLSYPARSIALQVKQSVTKVNRELRKLVRKREIECQTRTEFDYVPTRRAGNVACRRRRNYYWILSDPFDPPA